MVCFAFVFCHVLTFVRYVEAYYRFGLLGFVKKEKSIHRIASHSLEIKALHPLNNRFHENVTNSAVSFTSVKIILQLTMCLRFCEK